MLRRDDKREAAVVINRLARLSYPIWSSRSRLLQALKLFWRQRLWLL